jgi:hypothetical protein
VTRFPAGRDTLPFDRLFILARRDCEAEPMTVESVIILGRSTEGDMVISAHAAKKQMNAHLRGS